MAVDGGLLKCPFCNCFFAVAADLELHLRVFGRYVHDGVVDNCHLRFEQGGLDDGDVDGWRVSRFGGEFKLASLDPGLAGVLKRQGSVVIGGYRYRLSRDGRFIVRCLVSL
ncbi:MAG: hypothetical protein NWF09_08925 [Candidatus Bathyarchaeota archaeon]|nr:hypothetical protein [Candidatus Bathyarchaeota archaeon]